MRCNDLLSKFNLPSGNIVCGEQNSFSLCIPCHIFISICMYHSGTVPKTHTQTNYMLRNGTDLTPIIKIGIVVIPPLFVIPLSRASWLGAEFAIYPLGINLSATPDGVHFTFIQIKRTMFLCVTTVKFDVLLDTFTFRLRSSM